MVDPRFAHSLWETSLQNNAVSHRLGANLESVLDYISFGLRGRVQQVKTKIETGQPWLAVKSHGSNIRNGIDCFTFLLARHLADVLRYVAKPLGTWNRLEMGDKISKTNTRNAVQLERCLYMDQNHWQVLKHCIGTHSDDQDWVTNMYKYRTDTWRF